MQSRAKPPGDRGGAAQEAPPRTDPSWRCPINGEGELRPDHARRAAPRIRNPADGTPRGERADVGRGHSEHATAQGDSVEIIRAAAVATAQRDIKTMDQLAARRADSHREARVALAPDRRDGEISLVEVMQAAHEASGAEMVTVAIRRIHLDDPSGKTMLDYIDRTKIHDSAQHGGCSRRRKRS